MTQETSTSEVNLSTALKVNLLFTACSAETGLEQLRPRWSSQAWGWSKLLGGSESVVSTPGCGLRRSLESTRQGGEMAASPDKVYHKRQRRPQLQCSLLHTGRLDHFLTGTCTDDKMLRGVICWMEAGARSPPRAGISKMQGRGQEIGGLKAKMMHGC